jgi:hypothetical protein
VNEAPRRRRSQDDAGGGGGLPLFPLILVVIFAGLLLGGILAHFLGAHSTSSNVVAKQQPLFTIAPVTLTPSPPPATLIPSVRPSTSASPVATQSPTPRVTPRTKAPARPLATASPHAIVYITPAPLRTTALLPTIEPALKPRSAVATTSTPVPNYVAPSSDQAGQIVRSYLGSLVRGDRATATTYLAHGLPNEAFMDAGSRIISIRPESSANQQYKVTADVQTSTGEYYITFLLQPGPGGLQITDHYAIKTQ